MRENFIRGDTKRCNGPLHQGEYIPLNEFWYHKRGRREGKPFSQCIRCENYNKFGDTGIHGMVNYSDVKFIFDELIFRVGKMEMARRIGVSNSFFSRRKRGNYKRIRKATVARAIIELKKARAQNEARHRKSIRHGAQARGRSERVPVKRSEFNGHDEWMREYQISNRKQNKEA